MATTLHDLVDTLQKALALVHSKSRDLEIKLTKAELEAKVLAKFSAEAGWKFELLGIDTTAQLKNSHTHTVTLELTPTDATANLGSPNVDELADAIIGLASDIKEISKNVSKNFTVGDFGLSLEVEVEKGGGVKIVVGADGSSSHVQKIKLSFRSRKS